MRNLEESVELVLSSGSIFDLQHTNQELSRKGWKPGSVRCRRIKEGGYSTQYVINAEPADSEGESLPNAAHNLNLRLSLELKGTNTEITKVVVFIFDDRMDDAIIAFGCGFHELDKALQRVSDLMNTFAGFNSFEGKTNISFGEKTIVISGRLEKAEG